MVEVHRVRERLRIIELGGAIKGITHLIPISGHKQRHRAGDTKRWNLNNAIWYVGLIQLEHGRQRIDIERRKIFRLNQQHHLLGVGVRRNVGHVQRIVLRGWELHAAGGRTQRLEQRLSGGFVARYRVKMHLVETKILFVTANQRKHDVHFIVIITVARRFHNLRDETVQAEIIHERLTQFIVSP